MTIAQEIERYQDLLRKNPAKEFSEFWEVNSCSLPLLTQLVNEFSILVASSVPSESSFSEAGYINNKQRASMHPTTLEHCMIVKHAEEF